MSNVKEIITANIEMNDVVAAFKRFSPNGTRVFYESYDDYPTTSSVELTASHFKGIASYKNQLIFTHTNILPLVDLDSNLGAIMIANKQSTPGGQDSITTLYRTDEYHADWSHPCSAQACGSFMAMGLQETDDSSCNANIYILDLTPLDDGAQPVSIGTIACVSVIGGQSQFSAVNGVAMTKEHGDTGMYIIAGLQGTALTIYRSVSSVLDPTITDNQFNVVGDTIPNFQRSGAGIALITQTDGSIFIVALDTDDDKGSNNSIYLYQLTINDSSVTCSDELLSMQMPVPGLSEAVRYATAPYILPFIFAQDAVCGAFLTIFATGAEDINTLNTSFRWGKGLAVTSPNDIEIYATDRNDLTTSQFDRPVDTKKDFSLVTWSTNTPGPGINVFHQGSSDLWYSVFDDNTWQADTNVSNVGVTDGPSAVVFNNLLYVFHQGSSDLWYSVFDGNTWQADTNVPNVGVTAAPSAVVFNNLLYVFHQGSSDLWYSVFDGNTWQADTNVPNVGVTAAPSAVVFNNLLYVFHQGSSDLWYSVFDGNTWQADTNVPNVGVTAAPSAVVFNKLLYVFHQGSSDLWYSVFDGNTWQADTNVPNVGVTAAPSAVVFNNLLYVFHQGSSDLWYSVFDGNTWQADTNVPNVGVTAGPSAVYWTGN